jgi:AcrR family transcriptional regulator
MCKHISKPLDKMTHVSYNNYDTCVIFLKGVIELAVKSEEKRKLILEKAKQVFIHKGFSGVTMKDIIEECEISRGGIYLYFSSVDEIFVEVIRRHNEKRANELRIDVKKADNFEALLNRYFGLQKKRLLHLENSLLLAMFEFFIAHKNEPDKDFFSGTFDVLENTITEILSYGADAGFIDAENIQILSANTLFSIKGLETLALSSGVSEELLDTQLGFIKNNILTRYRKNSYEE